MLTTLHYILISKIFPAMNRDTFINTELNKIDTWLKLTMNVDKSKTMLFHKRRKVNIINIKIDHKTMDRVSQFSFLGIMIDENLTWKNHVNILTNKLSKIIGILHRYKSIYPKHILLTIYNSLFIPHVNFGSLVWGTTIERISKFHKKALRTITHSNYIAHTEPLLKGLNLLNVSDMFFLKILKCLHTLSHDDLPLYFDIYRSFLNKIVTPYSLRKHPLPLPVIAHTFAESSLVFQLVKMKNNISVNDTWILKKIEERSHSHSGFST